MTARARAKSLSAGLRAATRSRRPSTPAQCRSSDNWPRPSRPATSSESPCAGARCRRRGGIPPSARTVSSRRRGAGCERVRGLCWRCAWPRTGATPGCSRSRRACQRRPLQLCPGIRFLDEAGVEQRPIANVALADRPGPPGRGQSVISTSQAPNDGRQARVFSVGFVVPTRRSAGPVRSRRLAPLSIRNDESSSCRLPLEQVARL